MGKSTQLQIRVSPEQKDRIKKQATLAGEDVSKWVLKRLLPPEADQIQNMINRLGAGDAASFVLAEVNDFLMSLSRGTLEVAIHTIDVSMLKPFESNYVAAMIEQACAKKALQPPGWVYAIAPLASPWFASELSSLKLHLLTASPPPFRRRNLFVDSTLGDRV
jgi:hypothetical protein|tara:strand:+ start:18 stop:506 length:489 start_codon:yes stop_codon:yes gene_type:complete